MNKDTVVLITGCSSGIGRSLAGKLSGEGYTVIATARNAASLQDLQAALKLPLDVTKMETIQRSVDEVITRFGKIDILVNNAGYAIRGVLEEIPIEDVEKEFDVNVFGMIRMIQAVAPHMRRQRSGKIINIGSISGKFSQPVNGAYCGSKFAVEALTDSLRLELFSHNIQVTVIEPGPVDTNFCKTSNENSTDITGNVDSPYAALYEADRSFRQKQNWSDRQKAVDAIARIITGERLETRYKVAVPFISRMIARFPDGIRDYMMRSVYRIQ